MSEITLEEIDEALEDLAHTGTIYKGLLGYKAFCILLRLKKQNEK